MKPEQQHHIRNGSITILQIVRVLLRCTENLSGNQITMIKKIGQQAERIEKACKPLEVEEENG